MLLRRGLMRMLHRMLAMPLGKWRSEAAQMKREKFMLAGAANRMLKRQLSMAWEQWQYKAAEMARQQCLMSGAANRMLNRKLSMAFEKWQYTAAEMARQQFLMNGYFLFYINKFKKHIPFSPNQLPIINIFDFVA